MSSAKAAARADPRRRSGRPAATCRAPGASPGSRRRTSASRAILSVAAPLCRGQRWPGRRSLSRVKVRNSRRASAAGRGRSRAHRKADPVRDHEARVDRRREDPGRGRLPAGDQPHLRGRPAHRRRTSSETTGGSRATWPRPGCSRTRSSASSCARRPDPGLPRVTGRRRCLRRRGRRRARGAVRRGLPRGHDHPRPGPLADARQVRCRTDRPGHRRPVVPIGHWGAQEVLAPYAKRPDLFPRKRITMLVGDPVDLDDLVGRAAPAVINEATDRIMAAITDWSRSCAARPRRRAVQPPHRRRPGVRQPQRGRTEGKRMHEQGRGVRCRLVGNGVLHRARRRRQRRHDLGPSRGGRRGDQRATARTPSTSPGSSSRRRSGPPTTSRSRRPAPTSSSSRRPPRRFRTNLDDWAPYLRRRRGAGVADEGRRARHPRPDERGDRGGHRCRPRADRGDQRAQPGQGDRPA